MSRFGHAIKKYAFQIHYYGLGQLSSSGQFSFGGYSFLSPTRHQNYVAQIRGIDFRISDSFTNSGRGRA
jgi:hypothetical protein